MAGKYPAILTDEIVGIEATKLHHDALAMLDKIIREKWLTAHAVVGLFPANSDGADDIHIYTDESRTTKRKTVHHLRQQLKKAAGQPNFCLADYIAPKETGKKDYLGAFAVTAGGEIEQRVAAFEAAHDDYSAILLKSLADRLAEALAEYMHAYMRRHFWAYAPHENLDNNALITEQYQGIRPAPGYPACPDHTEKGLLWDLLSVKAHTGMFLTESFAMYPAASVSGWYFSHPDSKYFGLGQIDSDQVVDYAERTGYSVKEMERWLAPVIN